MYGWVLAGTSCVFVNVCVGVGTETELAARLRKRFQKSKSKSAKLLDKRLELLAAVGHEAVALHLTHRVSEARLVGDPGFISHLQTHHAHTYTLLTTVPDLLAGHIQGYRAEMRAKAAVAANPAIAAVLAAQTQPKQTTTGEGMGVGGEGEGGGAVEAEGAGANKRPRPGPAHKLPGFRADVSSMTQNEVVYAVNSGVARAWQVEQLLAAHTVLRPDHQMQHANKAELYSELAKLAAGEPVVPLEAVTAPQEPQKEKPASGPYITAYVGT